jgi:hypothetical protein
MILFTVPAGCGHVRNEGCFPMTSFDEYRDRMLAIIATAEKLLLADAATDTEVLDLCRARMSRIFTAYHLYADRELFTPCMALSEPMQRARVKEISAECAVLAQEFRAFTRQCVDNPVSERWQEYRVAASAMMGRIRRHLAAAETEVRQCELLGTFACLQPPMRKAG